MSDPKPKSPKKRRSRGRHRKRQAARAQNAKHVQPNIAPATEEVPSEVTRKLKLQLDPEYIREEQEVKSSLEKLETDLDSDQLHSTDREVLFFVDSLPELFYDAQDQLDGEGGETEHERVTHEKSPSLRSVSNTQDSPTHLASSYVQPEENEVIQWNKSEKLLLNDDLLFVPSKSLAEVRGYLEQVTVGSDAGSGIMEEGLVKPSLNDSNKARLINRLIEEEREEWFDASGDLVNLQSFIVDKRVRSVCGKKFVPYFVEPIPMSQTVEQLPAERTVKVLIGKLRFENHPSFDETAKMRLKLEQIYKQYYTNRKLKVVSGLQKKLDDLRCTTDESNEQCFSFKMQRREVRKLVYKEAKSERQMEKQILELWKELKDFKSEQGIKVIVASDELDREETKASWNERFNKELEEVIEEEHELYIKEKQEYKAYLRDLEENMNEDEVVPVQKPKKPDVSRLKQEFKKTFTDSFRALEEPIIDIFLRKEPNHTMQTNFNTELRFKIKFYIDDEHLASTKPREFQEDLLVDFNTSFAVKLTTKIPEAMRIELYEKNRLKHKIKIAEIFIPLPNSDEVFDEVEYIQYEFSTGKPYKSNEYRNGKIDLKVGWLEQSGSSFPSPSKRRNLPKRVNLSKELLKKWFDDQLLDPNDSDAEILMKALENPNLDQDSGNEKEDLQEKDDPFIFNEDLLAFCSEEEINNNERLNMLIQRFNSNMRYKNIRFVPQIEREIEIPNETKIIDETLGTDPIDLQRHYGKKYLKKVYDTITNHCSVINQDKIDDNLLIGDQVPTMESLRMIFSKIFGPRRPLKPSRRSPLSRATIKITDMSNLKIIVTVVRAFGIPMRSDDHQVASPGGRRNSSISSTKFSFRASNVRPYITVSIKDKNFRTSTADGTNPTWNEQLTIPLDAASDQIRKFLNIDLYDEVTEDLLEDDRARTTEVYQRISSKWLGQLRIPISTIYLNHRIEGTFEIRTPPILFGYTQCSSEAPEYTSMFIGSSLPDMRELGHISLFISLEPNVETPNLDTNGLECVEFEQTRAHTYLWFEEYRNEFPLRAKVPLVTLLSGKRVSITRLLGPINVPFVLDENVEPMIRRYVSLIPIHHNTDACSQLDGVWLTNKEILSMMCASPKDLGVLLACFYTALDFDCYLILGHSLLNGDSTFVLLRESNEFFIVDPTSGKKYSSTDTYCPLNRIYYIVNQDNLWGNIQKENRVFLTQLDVNKSAYWRPLFTRTHEAPTGCVHDGKYLYRNAFSVRDLQKTIERKLFKKIGTWRTHRKTIWNRYISEQLKYVLSSLETDTCLEVSTDRHMEILNRLFISHKINGFPINFPYTNLSNTIAQVKGTGIHLNSENNVEFGLGVYIKDYPCNIYSVWIFLVSLVPKL